jgi:serine protease
MCNDECLGMLRTGPPMMLDRVLLGFALAVFLAGGCVLILVSTSSVTIPPMPDQQVMPKQHFGFPPAAATSEQLLPDGSFPPPREVYTLPSVRQLASEVLWQYVMRADGHVIIGVKDRAPRGYFRGKVLVDDARVEAIRTQLHREIGGLQLVNDDRPIPRTAANEKFPVFKARLTSLEDLAALRRSPLVDYVEPGFFEDSLACTKNDYHAKSLDSADSKFHLDGAAGEREGSTDFDVVPYPFAYMGVVSAWRRLIYNMGRGYDYNYPGHDKMVGVLDSGASPDQDQLNEHFFLNGARPRATHLTATSEAPGDTCGHGTRIAGLATAPRDGENIIGVAWGAPLVTVKIDNSPLVWGGRYTVDVAAICDGISKVKAAGARVISMAFGLLYTSPTIEQCIKDAFDSTPEMIFVAAAGTTTSWVVFPAVMNREVLAVSLVEISPLGGFKMLPFGQVAYGTDVDFVIPITTDDVPSTGLLTGQVWSLGGSSAATAQLTGLISLVWSHFPDESRDQVIQRIRQASSIEGITDQGGLPPFSQVGAGMPNAFLAIGGATRIDIVGPTEGTPGSTIQLQAVSNGVDQFAYTWSPGAVSGQFFSVTLPSTVGAVVNVGVTARDNIAQVNYAAIHTIQVKTSVSPATTVKLYSADWVLEYPVFFDGNKLDRTINGGVRMPAGCAVTALTGIRICHSVTGQPWYTCSGEVPAASGGPNNSAWGFVVFRDAASGPTDLTANFHVWHDGVTEIRARAVYTVAQPAGTDCSVPAKTQPGAL